MASRSKTPAIGSAQWLLDERHQSNDLVNQELEDFGFSLRNELEWLNEHMGEIFAKNGQSNLDVYKTPGKLRGKTPRTARKRHAIESRQPLGDLLNTNSLRKQSPAQKALQSNLQKNSTKARFRIAEDTQRVAPQHSPATRSTSPRSLFGKALGKGKENHDSGYHANTSEDEQPMERLPFGFPSLPSQGSPAYSTQDTVMDTQEDTQIFTQVTTQSTQPTQPTQSFRKSLHSSEDERRDTGESFVSAKEAFASKNASKENLRDDFHMDAMDIDDKQDTIQTHAEDTAGRQELSSPDEGATMIHHDLPTAPTTRHQTVSEHHSNSLETQNALETAHRRPLVPEQRIPVLPSEQNSVSAGTHTAVHATAGQDDTMVHHDIDDPMDTVVHHDMDDQLDADEDIRSPSDGSSPVKPLIRKSSLTFASLPAREPLLAKKSLGNRVSRTSHVDQNKTSRFTGGKSLGGSQIAHASENHAHDATESDGERPELRREESETTKLHNKTSTMRLAERINMLSQQNDPPKRTSQNVMTSHSTQSQSMTSSQPTQLAYPQLGSKQLANVDILDDDDDWISPIRNGAPALEPTRPALSKSYSADTRPPVPKELILPKPISVSNPNLSTVVESTTPAGSPTALRAAKEKIIGSSATSAQVKLDALAEGTMRPILQTQSSSEDIFTSPKRTEKAGLFSHLRSPSKESLKTSKSTKIAAIPGSPTKVDGRRTRSSSEREKQKEKDAREKDVKQKQRAEERFKEMREKEQSKAAAHYQKSKAAAKTPVAAQMQAANPRPGLATATKTPSSVSQPLSRPGTTRMNTVTRLQEPDSAEDMPPPPPPKSQLPTGAGQKLREPKRLAKAPSKQALPKAEPQKIMVNLNGYSRAPLGTSKAAPPAPPKDVPVAAKVAAPALKPAPPVSAKTSHRPIPLPKMAPPPKQAPRVGRPPQPVQKAAEKAKPVPTQPRADLSTVRPVSRMQTVQDANRINIPPVNPAKPAKRPFQPETDEPLHRPAKRPSQQAKSKPVTPAHAQFAQGRIPFAEPVAPPTIQYPNGEDIKLPEIMTDSEDEDSENEFDPPSWVNTPELRGALERQQLLDPEQVFGPIAPLNMEQIFPNKERHKRFRDRTSSAYWANDQVTEDEKRRVREAQERLVQQGAWTYHPSPGPSTQH